MNKITKNGPPNASAVRMILAEIVTSVEALHNASIFHDDLNPKNILIDNEGHLRVIDYGLSSWFSEDIERTQSDWANIYYKFHQVLRNPRKDNHNHLSDVMELLKYMTLLQLPGKVPSVRFFSRIRQMREQF